MRVKSTILTKRSLAEINPRLTREWHPTKNGKLTPKDVTPGANKKVWWRCKKSHEWKAKVSNRNRGNSCPYCSGRKATKENCLVFENPILAREWHPAKNGKLMPWDVTPKSGKKVWWRCKRGHAWKTIIANRSTGRRCPYCSGRKVGKDNCLQTVNPSLSREWHPIKNGKLTPRDVVPGSNKKVWWKCKKVHEWKTIIRDRKNDPGCHFCWGKLRKGLFKSRKAPRF